MTASSDTSRDDTVVALQIGRVPRSPWRTVTRCRFGLPVVIVSPSRLADGRPFPSWAWLTCPHVSEAAARAESSGALAVWRQRIAEDPGLAEKLTALDEEVRRRRLGESNGRDACGDLGLAGQRDPLAVKCLHAHAAYALAGLDDPIGRELIGGGSAECDDARCETLADLGRVSE